MQLTRIILIISYMCESFSKDGIRKKYIKTIHDGHKGPNCGICGKSFSTKSNLTNYIKQGKKGIISTDISVLLRKS